MIIYIKGPDRGAARAVGGEHDHHRLPRCSARPPGTSAPLADPSITVPSRISALFCSPFVPLGAPYADVPYRGFCVQAGEEYARRTEAKLREDFAKKHPAGAPEASEADASTESKKDK